MILVCLGIKKAVKDQSYCTLKPLRGAFTSEVTHMIDIHFL